MSPPDVSALPKDQKSETQNVQPVTDQATDGAKGAPLNDAADAAAKRMAKGGKTKPEPTSDGDDAAGKKGDKGSLTLNNKNDVMAYFTDLVGKNGKGVDKLTAADRASIARLAPDTLDDVEKAGLKLVFDATPNGELETLKQLINVRYRIGTVGKDKDKGSPDWDAAGLRRTWTVLEQLPPAQVEGNPKIYSLVRYKTDKGTAAEGYYQEDSDDGKTAANELAIAYTPGKLDDVDKGEFTDKQDPMYGLNIFNGTVRHEVGHAVDAAGKFSDNWCVNNANGGNWKNYDDKYETVLGEIVAATNGGIGKASEKDALLKELAKIMKQQKFDNIEKLLTAAPFWSKMKADEQKEILADPALKVLGHNTTANEPWMDGNGGVAVSGRIFQEAYDQSWVSYAAEARDRKCSKYQFRAPGEWFAEAYATYYEPPTKENPKGALLGKIDPKTKAFFDSSVDTMGAKKTDMPNQMKGTKPKASA
jgi:hypothetical protein